MFFCSFYSLVLGTFGGNCNLNLALITGEMFFALRLYTHSPVALWDQIELAFFSLFGQIFIFMGLAWMGSLYLSIVTTTRKIFSVFVSIITFGYVLNSGQKWGVSLIIAGIAGELVFGVAKKVISEQKKGKVKSS